MESEGLTMRIEPIKTVTDYHEALEEIERLFDATSGTREGDQLEILTTRMTLAL